MWFFVYFITIMLKDRLGWWCEEYSVMFAVKSAYTFCPHVFKWNDLTFLCNNLTVQGQVVLFRTPFSLWEKLLHAFRAYRRSSKYNQNWNWSHEIDWKAVRLVAVKIIKVQKCSFVIQLLFGEQGSVDDGSPWVDLLPSNCCDLEFYFFKKGPYIHSVFYPKFA